MRELFLPSERDGAIIADGGISKPGTMSKRKALDLDRVNLLKGEISRFIFHPTYFSLNKNIF